MKDQLMKNHFNGEDRNKEEIIFETKKAKS